MSLAEWIDAIFTTEEFLKVALGNCRKWDLNPQSLSFVQMLWVWYRAMSSTHTLPLLHSYSNLTFIQCSDFILTTAFFGRHIYHNWSFTQVQVLVFSMLIYVLQHKNKKYLSPFVLFWENKHWKFYFQILLESNRLRKQHPACITYYRKFNSIISFPWIIPSVAVKISDETVRVCATFTTCFAS